MIITNQTLQESKLLDLFENIFDNTGAVINTKKSKTGKYVSVSIVVNLDSANSVINYYKKAEKIEGIISL